MQFMNRYDSVTGQCDQLKVAPDYWDRDNRLPKGRTKSISKITCKINQCTDKYVKGVQCTGDNSV